MNLLLSFQKSYQSLQSMGHQGFLLNITNPNVYESNFRPPQIQLLRTWHETFKFVLPKLYHFISKVWATEVKSSSFWIHSAFYVVSFPFPPPFCYIFSQFFSKLSWITQIFSNFTQFYLGFPISLYGFSPFFPSFLLGPTGTSPLRRQFFDLVQAIIQARQKGLAMT